MNEMSNEQTFTLEIHEEDGAFWGEVLELPGCFSAGDTLDELEEATVEAILMVLDASGDAVNADCKFPKSPPMVARHDGIKSARIAVHA